MGGRGPTEGRKPGGKRGSLRLFVFAREGGEGRADTSAFALGYGEGGQPGRRPLGPARTKARLGTRRRRVTIILQASPGETPPVRPASPSPSWTLQGPSRPRGHPGAVIGGRCGSGGPGLGRWGHPRQLILLIRASRPNPGLLCVSPDNRQRLPPSLLARGSGPGGQRGCSRMLDGGARGRAGGSEVMGCVVTQPPILFSFVERKKGVGVIYQIGFSHFCP